MVYEDFVGQIARLKGQGLIDPALPENTVLRLIISSVASWGVLRYLIAPDFDWDDPAEREWTIRVLARGLAPE